jgi:ribosomal-protein-alanine N-acetyltransferase
MRTIETKDVILRPFQESDVEDLFSYASVPGVGENAGWRHHTSLEESKAVLYNHFLSDELSFAIVFKKNHHVIGSFSLKKRTKMTMDFKDLKVMEIGYVLSKRYWNKGIMSRLVSKAVEAVFEDGIADVLLICCHDLNYGSQRVAEKNGFHKYKIVPDVYYESLDEKRTMFYYYKEKEVEHAL